MTDMDKPLRVIARVRNDFPTKFGLPRQSGLAESLRSLIVFEKAFRVPEALRGLEALLRETLGDHTAESVSLRKIEEMTRKLQSGYTSYWT